MNDQDIIRKAVTLADGWEIGASGKVIHHTEELRGFDVHTKFMPQWALDALAAQLCRQVDAMHGDKKTAIIQYEETYVYSGDKEAVGIGPDRTMNTLRAIVESGVLE